MGAAYQTKCIFVIHSERDNDIIGEFKKYFDPPLSPQFYFDPTNNVYTKFEIEVLDSQTGAYVGENFSKKIRKKFNNCYYYLIILTNNSKDKIWVNQEIGYAQAKSMKRCMVMVDDNLKGEYFGMIHSNYDVLYFSSLNFNIDNDGTQIKKIENKIEEKFGKKSIPPDTISLPKGAKISKEVYIGVV